MSQSTNYPTATAEGITIYSPYSMALCSKLPTSIFMPFSRVVPPKGDQPSRAVFSNEEGFFVYIDLTEAEAMDLHRDEATGNIGLLVKPLKHFPIPKSLVKATLSELKTN